MIFSPGTDTASYMDDNDDDGFVSQERPQRRVPVSQDNEDLVVKGNTSNILHLQQCTQGRKKTQVRLLGASKFCSWASENGSLVAVLLVIIPVKNN